MMRFAGTRGGSALPGLGAALVVTVVTVVTMVLAVPSRGAAQAPAMREGHAPVPGANIFYIDSGGSGTPVVFLHPGTGSVRIWEHQIPAFVAAGYRFIAYDRRGYGRTTVETVVEGSGGSRGSGGSAGSTRSTGSAGPRVPAPADDLNALMDYLKIDRFHIVASAAGGAVALDYAVSFPQRLRSLVIANSLGAGDIPELRAMTARLLPPQFQPLPPEFKELSPSYRASNPEGTARWVALEHLSRAEGPRPPAQPARNRITTDDLRALKVPTFILTGDADLYSPPPLMRLFADRIPGAVLLAIRDVGHSTYWEQPDQFNRAILEFLRMH